MQARSRIVQIERKHIATLLGAGAAVIAIVGAPIASADTGTTAQESCTTTGASATVCQSSGNVQLNDAPPPVAFYPYGGEAGLLGGGGGRG
jgi:hypothetical protein